MTEVSELTEEALLGGLQHAAFDYVDEVWTATRFVASGIRAVGRKPVYTIPLPVPTPAISALVRTTLFRRHRKDE